MSTIFELTTEQTLFELEGAELIAPMVNAASAAAALSQAWASGTLPGGAGTKSAREYALAAAAEASMAHADAVAVHSDRGVVETYVSGLTPPTALPLGAATAANYQALTGLLKATLSPFYPVSVLGAISAGDGGAGVWRWFPDSTTTADGGMVLASAEGGAGRWLRVLATREIWLEWFGADMTGATQSHAQAQAWFNAVKTITQVGRMGPGTVLLGQPTLQLTLTTQRLVFRGAGGKKSKFRKADNAVTANAQSMIRFYDGMTDGFAEVDWQGISVDFNCNNNVTPGGNLPGNFAWQHCEALEFRPTVTNGFHKITIIDVEIVDPISDGISIRGGAVNNLHIERCGNYTWPLTGQRPRVRGDICITALVRRGTIRDCRLPRLHYELEYEVPVGFEAIIDEYNNECGEVLAHWAGNGGHPERAIRRVWGGSIHYGLFQGNADTTHNGTYLNFNGGSSRLTGGKSIFRDCPVHLGPNYVGGPGTFLFSTSPPTTHQFEFTGRVRITADPAATPPAWFVQGDHAYQSEAGALLEGFTSTLPQMRGATCGNNKLVAVDTTWSFDGTGPDGVTVFAVFNASPDRKTSGKLWGNELLHPNAKLLLGGVAQIDDKQVIDISMANNVTAPGMLIDFSSPAGQQSRRRLFPPFNHVDPASPSWTFVHLDQDARSDSKPAAGDWIRGQSILKNAIDPSASPGWYCVRSGPAAPANFAPMPILGA